MNKYLLVLFLALTSFSGLYANVGDTTWVAVAHNDSLTHPGIFDFQTLFPSGTVQYRKIYMIFTLGEYNCPAGTQYCHQWDYDLENYIMVPGGDTLEMARFITPYANSGVPGFPTTWQQPYIFDVTDFYPMLKDSAGIRVNYSGYSYGFTLSINFAFIEGTPERNVLAITPLWDQTSTYGNPANPIDSNVLPVTFTPPAGSASTEMKLIITGHGADSASGCCEFDFSGNGHNYTVMADNNPVYQTNMNMNCGVSELYPQGGTWLVYRAGNWCPGGLVSTAQVPLTGISAGSVSTTDLNFDDTYDGLKNYGIYKITAQAFSYGSYNKTLDASVEDIIAPTNFPWYRRENPRVSNPVIKVRNTGGTTINSMLLSYGVKDSTLSQYVWTGSLAPLTDTIITLPAIKALTNLSLNSATGTHNFIVLLEQVNGQTDNDQSNDSLTSQFLVAPKWPNTLRIKLTTGNINPSGNFGSNPSDASWQITDENNNIIASRTNNNITTTYYDTVKLPSAGFYALTVNTLACAGLQWWYYTDFYEGAPYNYVPGAMAVQNYLSGNSILSLNGTTNSGTYLDDFGCGFTQYFTTAGECQAAIPSITMTGDTLKATNGAGFQWYKNGNLISGANSQTYVITPGFGNYTVEVTNYSGCAASSATFLVLNTGSQNLSDYANSISVFPNPARDMFNLVVSAELTGTSYVLQDMTGRSLLSGKVENESTQVPVRGISSGVYLLTVFDGASSVTRRVVIQK